MEMTLIIIVLVAASLGGTALMIMAKRKTQAKRDAVYEMCQRNGWRYDQTTDPTGNIRITQITDPRDTWMVEEHFSSNSESDSTTRRTTWTDADAGIPAGLAVMSLAMPDGKADGMEKFLGMMGDGAMEQHMVKTFFGAVGEGTNDLEAVNLTGAAGLMMATPDAREALTPIAFHTDLADTKTAMPKNAMPTVIRSTDGLQLQIKDVMKSADRVEAMIGLGKMLSAALKSA